MLASVVDNLAKIHQRITEILPFDLNHDFSQFPHFIKMQKPTCDCAKMKHEKMSFCSFWNSSIFEGGSGWGETVPERKGRFQEQGHGFSPSESPVQ